MYVRTSNTTIRTSGTVCVKMKHHNVIHMSPYCAKDHVSIYRTMRDVSVRCIIIGGAYWAPSNT